MTRVLYWNINNFSFDRFFNVNHPSYNQFYYFYLLDVILACRPDVIVVVEVSDQNLPVGLVEGTPLVRGGGSSATLWVLDFLWTFERLNLLTTDFYLVPPLTSGHGRYRESIAVFYNRNNLEFLGPLVFGDLVDATGTIAYSNLSHPFNGCDDPLARGLTRLTSQFNVTPYQNFSNGLWQGCLPNRPVNLGTQVILDYYDSIYGPGFRGNIPNFPVPLNENQLAGQSQFFAGGLPQWDPEPTLQLFGGPNRISFPGIWNRSPFLTSFYDNQNNRIIKLFSVHTSPATARQAVQNLANIPEIQNVNADEVSVIVGDFNVDSFGNGNGAYIPLDQNYNMHLDPRNAQNQVDPARKPFCMTHLLPVRHATPFNDDLTNIPQGQPDPRHNVYPRFGYMGSGTANGGFSDSGAIDNIFTCYGARAGGPAQDMTILNAVAGSPYGPPANVANLQGAVPFGSLLNVPNSLNSPNGRVDPGPFIAQGLLLINFAGNFRPIRATSDHLPLYIDV